jgi:hypothetical protein
MITSELGFPKEAQQPTDGRGEPEMMAREELLRVVKPLIDFVNG